MFEPYPSARVRGSAPAPTDAHRTGPAPGVPETEVSGFVRLHHLGTGAPGCIVVFERGEWGNGATRLGALPVALW